MSAKANQLKPDVPTLHHLQSSQSQRILWLLCELELVYPNNSTHPFAFNVVHYKRIKSRPHKELAKIHPLAKSPILVTSDGRKIHESTTILSYLIQTYDVEGHFQPSPEEVKEGYDWIRDDSLSSFGASTMSGVMMLRIILEIAATITPFFASWIFSLPNMILNRLFTNPEIETCLKYLQDEILQDSPYFMGSKPGRADFATSWPMDMYVQRGWVNLDEERWRGLKAWYDRIHAREGWKKSQEKGNGYSLAFKKNFDKS
ncbi:MAG: hypothetical protein Q9227_008199 [Pyrenula ochraceoflavens]